MKTLKFLQCLCDKISNIVGGACFILILGLIALVFYNVFSRYVLISSSVALQELEWYLFSSSFLLSMSYVLKEDAHVRVDMFYSVVKPKTKALINIFGVVFFLVPFCLIVMNSGWTFVELAYEINEKSSNPGGLSNTWIIKSVIPMSFFLLLISGFGVFFKNLIVLMQKDEGSLK